MKTSQLVLFLITMISISMINITFTSHIKKETSKLGNNNLKHEPQLKEDTEENKSESEDSTGVAGENSNRKLKSLDGLISPKYRTHLKNNNSNVDSNTITANTTKESGVYYDGNAQWRAKCAGKKANKSCVNEKNCGWCSETNKCIPGNSNGPALPCGKNNFYFENEDLNAVWSPETAGVINIHTSGKLVLTPHPDLSNVLVDEKFK